MFSKRKYEIRDWYARGPLLPGMKRFSDERRRIFSAKRYVFRPEQWAVHTREKQIFQLRISPIAEHFKFRGYGGIIIRRLRCHRGWAEIGTQYLAMATICGISTNIFIKTSDMHAIDGASDFLWEQVLDAPKWQKLVCDIKIPDSHM